MGAAIIGIVIANSPFGPAFLDFKHAYVGFESIGLSLSVEHWVSDLLLATFFLVAGLELKYELQVACFLNLPVLLFQCWPASVALLYPH